VASITLSRARRRFLADGGDTPCAEEHENGLFRHARQLLHEDGPALAQGATNVAVVDDLVPHVDRRPVQLQRQVDDIVARSTPAQIAARAGQEDVEPGIGARGMGWRRGWVGAGDGAGPDRFQSMTLK
jgi:hypothetical protein